jgi:2-succinyl-5-enolpyruvyl-6-hydroxy-3-cyclohexene-1-carboxylate synthase
VLGWSTVEQRPEDVQATFAATLVDEWTRRGVTDAVVAPGSRSTPLALALAADPRVRVHVHPDERSASFLALGLALATGRPPVVLTTSGTATAHLHAAVVEADLAEVPLLVCTADRPPELQGVGAPQAIDQVHLYGRSVRAFLDPGVADAAGRGRWRGLAAHALAEATAPAHPGPVHLNLAFREPLLGTPGPLPDAPAEDAEGDGSEAVVLAGSVLTLVDELAGRRGVVVAGPGSGPGAALHELATALGWPVLAAPQADVWGVPGAVIPAADALLRVPALAEALRPEVVLRLGTPLASKVAGEWVARSGAHEIAAAGAGRRIDPHGTADVVLPVAPGALLAAWSAAVGELRPTEGGAWRARWEQAGATALAAIARALDAEAGPTEPGVARAISAALPPDADLVVSSSMPVRDLEWYADPRPGVRVHANRGANGIDGVVSTALGVALGARRPTAVLLGDLAFLHDSNGLLGAAARGADLVVVVVDNDGGGIFSFLPQAAAVPAERFEQLFGTPHGVDLVGLAAAHGLIARVVDDDVGAAVAAALAEGGVQVLVVRTTRSGNVEVHDRLHAAVAAAVASAA